MMMFFDDWRCAVGRRLPGAPCPKDRWGVPGALRLTTCWRHATAETRGVLAAMVTP